MYFQIITDYGFNLSATREISINRDNKEKISEIFSSVMIIKLLLLVLSFIIMSVIVFSFEKFRQDWLLYYLTFGMVIGQTLFPIWFFQGMERMKYITYLNITAKLIFTISIFVFVKNVSDYIYVPLLNSIGFIIAGVLSVIVSFRCFEINLTFLKFSNIFYQLKEGWNIFFSNIFITFFNGTNIIILSLIHGNIYVGYYVAAEKIINAIVASQVPLVNSIFPYFSKGFSTDKDEYLKRLCKVRNFGLLLYFLVFILCFFLADNIIDFMYGDHMQKSVFIFKILSVILLFIFFFFFQAEDGIRDGTS